MNIGNIRFFDSFNIYKKQNPLPKVRLRPRLTQDTVSFSGAKDRSPVNEKLKKLPEKEFPSPSLRTYILSEIDKPENADKDLITLHREFYKGLETCATLDEAKEMYPEFNDVIDAKTLDVSKMTKRSIYFQIQNGEYEGLSLENLSLELLKRYSGRVFTVKRGYNEEYFGMDRGVINNMLSGLNIRTKSKLYKNLLVATKTKKETTERWQDENEAKKMRDGLRSEQSRSKISKKAKQRWQDETYRQNQHEKFTSAEFRESQSKKLKAYYANNEEARKAISEKQTTIWQDEQKRQAQSEATKQMWQDENFRAKQHAAKATDEFKKGQSERMIALWQNEAQRTRYVNAIKQKDVQLKRSKSVEKLWQDESYLEHQKEGRTSEHAIERKKITDAALKEAWNRHGEIRQIMSEVAKDVPMLTRAIQNIENNTATDVDINCIKGYFKKCGEMAPDFQKIIGKTQKEILGEWGFYDDKNN